LEIEDVIVEPADESEPITPADTGVAWSGAVGVAVQGREPGGGAVVRQRRMRWRSGGLGQQKTPAGIA
jgi:hypothetical protein